jgi:hypothetical protein
MPPNCPDGNVLDYYVWSLLKGRLNKYRLVANFTKLKEILEKEWNAIPQEVIRDAIDSWQSRIRRIELADGGHIVWFVLAILKTIKLSIFLRFLVFCFYFNGGEKYN